MNQVQANLEELNEHDTLGLSEDETKQVLEALGAGVDVMEILGPLNAQYREHGLSLRLSPRPTKTETTNKAVEGGLTDIDLFEVRMNSVISAFSCQPRVIQPECFDDDAAKQFGVACYPGMSLTEDQIGRLVHLGDEPLWMLIADMVTGGPLVEQDDVYLLAPKEELAA